jgi:RNA polymerase sigma factor (sigma-70 family)
VDDAGDRRIPEHHAAEVAGFYEAHARWLSGHALLRARPDRELAADLVQDTFVAAACAWETLRGLAPGQQRAWLRTTLSHKEASHFRRRQALDHRQPELHRMYQGAEPDPEQQALSGLALEKVAKIIRSLPARQGRIALMKWDDHMKESEIAGQLGCSKGTVSAEVQRIRRALIDGLGPYYPFAGDVRDGVTSCPPEGRRERSRP